MPTFVADQPGVYKIQLIVIDDMRFESEPDQVKVIALVPAVAAKGVGLSGEGEREGIITLALPDYPVKAFLTWQGKSRNRNISFGYDSQMMSIRGERLTDPESNSLRCFYQDITDVIADAVEEAKLPNDPIDYSVMVSDSVIGAGIIVIVAAPDTFTELPGDSIAGGRLSTLSTIILDPLNEPHRRIEVKAGCDFFFHNSPESTARYESPPIRFSFASSHVVRQGNVTLMVGDAQSGDDIPRLSEIQFLSPADAEPILLGQNKSGLIASDGCNWDTFGRNSGISFIEDLGCLPMLFDPVGDPDRRGEVKIPAEATSAIIQLVSPLTPEGPTGVSAAISLAVFELLEPPQESLIDGE